MFIIPLSCSFSLPFLSLCVCLSVCLTLSFLSLFIYVSLPLSAYLPIYLPACLPVYLPACVSVSLLVKTSVLATKETDLEIPLNKIICLGCGVGVSARKIRFGCNISLQKYFFKLSEIQQGCYIELVHILLDFNRKFFISDKEAKYSFHKVTRKCEVCYHCLLQPLYPPLFQDLLPPHLGT